MRLGLLGSSRSCWQSPEDDRQGSDVGAGARMGLLGLSKLGNRMQGKGEEEGNVQS